MDLKFVRMEKKRLKILLLLKIKILDFKISILKIKNSKLFDFKRKVLNFSI